MIQKLTALFMDKENKDFFKVYAKYFPTINKTLKLGRGGVVNVINNETKEVESYKNWGELNYIYKQLPIDKKWLNENHPHTQFKFWAFGDPTRYAELKAAMESKYTEICNSNIIFDSAMDFKKSGWVYYMDSSNNFCQTSNKMVIDLLQNSSDWTQIKLASKKLTKSDIAKLIGLSVDQFEIV